MQLGELNVQKIEIEPFAFIRDFEARLYAQYANIVEKTDLGQSVARMVVEDSRVIGLNGKMLARGSSAQIFESKTLAMWFLWCANEHGLSNAQRHLDSFLDSETISVLNTLWVLGIEVDQPISLDDGYTIQPIDQMPDSQDKEFFLQGRFGRMMQRIPTPTSAITKSCVVRKTWTQESADPLHNEQEFWSVTQQLHDIALILNALSGVSCLPYYSTTYVDPTTPLGPFGGSGGGSPIYDVLAQGLAKLPSESKSIIETLLSKYKKANDVDRGRIQRILNRLSQAKRRTQIEDKILDLGIALEMLLLDDNRNNDQLSLSFRLRGSWLIGQSAEDRVEKYRQLREIYEYRSQVAHSGVLCNGEATKIAEVRRSFSQYQDIAEDVCQKLIRDGKPDWSKLVLGAI